MTRISGNEFSAQLAAAKASAMRDSTTWSYGGGVLSHVELPAHFRTHTSVADVTVKSVDTSGVTKLTVIPAGDVTKNACKFVTLPPAVYWPGGELPAGILATESKRRAVQPGQFADLLGDMMAKYQPLLAKIARAHAKMDRPRLPAGQRAKLASIVDARRRQLHAEMAADTAEPAAPIEGKIEKPAAFMVPALPAPHPYPAHVLAALIALSEKEIEKMDQAESEFMDPRNDPILRRKFPEGSRKIVAPNTGDAAVYVYESEYRNKRGTVGKTYLAKAFKNGHGQHDFHRSFKSEIERDQVVNDFLAGETVKTRETV